MGYRKICFLAFCLTTLLVCFATADEEIVWKWTCEDGNCHKSRYDSKNPKGATSLQACKMFCYEYGLLWPRPTGRTSLGSFLAKINLDSIDVQRTSKGASDNLTEAATKRFLKIVSYAVPEGISVKKAGKSLSVFLVNREPDKKSFSLEMDEGYDLRIQPDGNTRINATIEASNFFGLRNGLETLSQLFVYDDMRNQLLLVRDVVIEDKPVYTYRGILLDTARNFFTVDSIKKTIDGMAAVKLNTFHWHITDSHSFPFQSERRPNLTKLGAYSPAKVYTKSQMSDIVQYGLERGVRVLPEFDAPAHVGEGWQGTNLTVCFKAEPWKDYCVEPPCGQLNPTREEVYEYLEDIYTEMAEIFQSDIFHMGGDEVSEQCWNSSSEIRDFMNANNWGVEKSSYLNLWNIFQSKAQERAYKSFNKKLPLILWTSTLTDYQHIDKFLDPDEYIIQVWTTGLNPQIQGLLQKGYKLIMSNYDALYFDCGFGAWIGSGNNWCSPYIGWQKVYDNSPALMALDKKDLIIGGEAALWSEQADTSTLDNRLWPRAAALAERLWAEPFSSWKDAEYRMLHMRERLARMGLQPESLEPEWCYQNEGYCYN